MGFLRRLLGPDDEERPTPPVPRQQELGDDDVDDLPVDQDNIDDAEIERHDRLGREWEERNEGREQAVACTQCGEATMREVAENEASSAANALLPPDGGLTYSLRLPTVDQFGDAVPHWIPDYGWSVLDTAVTVAFLAEEEKAVASGRRDFGDFERPARDTTEIAHDLARLERVGLARYDPERRGWNWPIVCPACISEIASGHRRIRFRSGSSSQRAAVAPRLRFAVMQRDGFRCTYCGRSAADGVTLHVDHVEPVAGGGADEEGNLVTACSDCNLGKGAEQIV